MSNKEQILREKWHKYENRGVSGDYQQDFEKEEQERYDWWISELSSLFTELEADIQKKIPMAWFPGSAGHLRKQFMETVLAIIHTYKIEDK